MITFLALALISAAILAYEVLLVRLFSIVQWYHFAFLAISIALLGFGASGALLAQFQRYLRARFTAAFATSALAFGLTTVTCFMLAQGLPFNALEVIWNPGQLFYLVAIYLLLAIPFLCGANCIGLAFIRFSDQIGRVYFWNLVGSGAGAIGVVLVLYLLPPLESLLLIAVLGLLSALFFAFGQKSRRWQIISASILILAVFIWRVVPEGWIELRVSEYKSLTAALKVKGASLIGEHSGPLALVSVVKSPEIPFRYVPGLSLQTPKLPPRQLGVFFDGDSLTTITEFDGQISALAYLDYTTDSVAYHLTKHPEVLILGAGGGRAVLQGIYNRAFAIDAVELSPVMIRLVRDDHAKMSGHLYDRPDVRIHVAEARGFVTASTRRWDLIQIPLLDSFGIAATGVHGFSESYVYTVEAFHHYLEHLRPNGWLSITRWLRLPARDTLKLFFTALVTLERRGSKLPHNHLAIIRGINTVTLLVKNGGITADDIETIKSFTEQRSFDLAYYPGMIASEANRFNIHDLPHLFIGANALIGPERNTFVARYKFDIRPATDDRPYFFDFFKWKTLPELMTLRPVGGAVLLEWGELILYGTLLQAAVLSLILIVAPLHFGGFSSALRARDSWRIAAYFSALGLAFLFVEISFIQRFIFFLGHPLYSVAVVLTGFLVFAGIGSGCSPALSTWLEAREHHTSSFVSLSAIEVAVVGITSISLFYLFALPPMLDALINLPDFYKILISLVSIAPLAFFMGMPFPLGLSHLSVRAPDFLPWAWGLNGCASVLSAILATILAMNFGYSLVIIIAITLYFLAALLFHTPLGQSQLKVRS